MTAPTAILVAHGQPSDPAPAQSDVAAIAARVETRLSGWQVRAATLAAPGALEQAIEGAPAPVIFPFFMADGWFIRTALPDRLAKAGASGARVLTPFGLLPEVHALATTAVVEAAMSRGWLIEETVLLLAAHGSGRSPYPAEAAARTADSIAATAAFAAIRTGFLEEAPDLAEAARGTGMRTVCLPLFVARWGHVADDIPEALRRAEFSGVLLPPLGTMAKVPSLIAAAIRRETSL